MFGIWKFETAATLHEIERMPESKFNSKVFMWAVSLRHPKVGKELHGIFTISEIKKKLEEMKAKQD